MYKLYIKDFKGNFNPKDNKLEVIRERVFSKTQVDVVYSDFTNWERYGLINIKHNVGKGGHKKLSYVDYVWLSIIKELRSFGFTYDQIKECQQELFRNLFNRDDLSSTIEKKDYIKTKSKGKLEGLEDFNEEAIDKVIGELFYIEAIMLNVLQFGESTILQFYKSAPVKVIPMSVNIMQDFDETGLRNILPEFFKLSHVNISLSNIISKFLVDGEESFESNVSNLISEKEYEILKAIRHNFHELKSITVRFDGKAEPFLMEIKSMKKVKVESRLLELINKGEYADIEIKTVDGRISHYEKVKKVKL
ncbi:helix-turn-helix domain-containing protein [Flavobacteriales bacterium]|nr:helix-turn-helix domain-containing protein [Flavobacteriales bacterium]